MLSQQTRTLLNVIDWLNQEPISLLIAGVIFSGRKPGASLMASAAPLVRINSSVFQPYAESLRFASFIMHFDDVQSCRDLLGRRVSQTCEVPLSTDRRVIPQATFF